MKRRGWVVWLAAIATVALTARLGLWQLDRAAQKIAVMEARLQQARASALSSAEIPATVVQARAAEHRRVALAGRWLAERTVYLDNRTMSARSGFFVITPLALDDGRMVLVQRGWWPRDAAERTRIAAPAPPGGEVRVQGRVALVPARVFELAAEVPGPIRQNLDPGAFAGETRLPLLPWVLVQLEDAGAPIGDGLVRRWAEPAADVNMHRGYAFQWFSFAGLVIALVVWFKIVRPWRRRRSASNS